MIHFSILFVFFFYLDMYLDILV